MNNGTQNTTAYSGTSPTTIRNTELKVVINMENNSELAMVLVKNIVIPKDTAKIPIKNVIPKRPPSHVFISIASSRKLSALVMFVNSSSDWFIGSDNANAESMRNIKAIIPKQTHNIILGSGSGVYLLVLVFSIFTGSCI